MSDDVERIPVIEEEARIAKRVADVERVSVRVVPEAEEVIVRERLAHDEVEIERVPVGREVTAVPPVRTEGEVTVVPVVEERLVVEKRLVLVEEVHLRRRVAVEDVTVPATLRRTRVEVSRERLDGEEKD